MLRTSKQKFVCKGVVTYLTPFKQRLKVTWKVLELFHSRIEEKMCSYRINSRLNFRFYAICAFSAKYRV